MTGKHKALLVFLVVGSLMPLAACLNSIFNPAGFEKMFKLPPSAETANMGVMFGVAVSYAWVLGFTAAYGVWKGRPEGLTLARIYGWITLGSGLVMTMKLEEKQFGVVDLVKGFLLLATAYL